MTHVDPEPGPLSAVDASPTLRELVNRFDSTLGRPPFTESQDLLDAAQQLRAGLSSCPAPKDLLAKEVCETLPIVASSLPLGFASSPEGFAGAKSLVLILCECLCIVAPVARFPLQDFLRATRTHFPDSKEVVKLHAAAGALDETVVREFLHLPAPITAGGAAAARTPAESKGSTAKLKKAGGGASTAIAPSCHNNTASNLKAAPEVVAALCKANLDPVSRKLLVQNFDTATKFCSLVGTDERVALAILDVFGSHLVPQLKPQALIPCMGVDTAATFVALLDCHASSLAVLLDEGPANPFRGAWCTAGCAADVLRAMAQRGNSGWRSEPFGFMVAVSLWLRPLALNNDIIVPCDCLATILQDVLGALQLVAHQAGPGVSQQRWLVTLAFVVDYMCSLVPRCGSRTALLDHVVMDAWPTLSTLLLGVLGEVSPSTGNRAPLSTPSKQPKQPPKTASGKKTTHAATAAASKDVNGGVTGVALLDVQGTAIHVLCVARRLLSLCPKSSAASKLFHDEGTSRIVERVVGLVDTPRRELLDAIASFVVAVQNMDSAAVVGVNHPPCLVQQLFASTAGSSVLCNIVRSRCCDAPKLVGRICHVATRWTSQEKEAHEKTLVRIVNASIDTIVSPETSNTLAWQLLDAMATLASSSDTFFSALCQHLSSTPTSSEVVLGHIEEMARSDGERFSNLLAVCTVVGRALKDAQSAAEAAREASSAERVDAARKKAEALEVQRQAHRAELKALRDKSLKAQERQKKLSDEAQQRLASTANKRTQEIEERHRATTDRLAALRAQAHQLKVAREEQMKASVKTYRERSAHTRNVAVYLQSVGISESRALTIASTLHARLMDCTHSHVLEYVVTGSLDLPQDMMQRAQQAAADTAAESIFADSGLSAATSAAAAPAGVSFWDLVMSDVRAEEGRQAGIVDPVAHCISSSAEKPHSFHFRIAPLMDLFSFDEDADDGSRHTSIPVRQVKLSLESTDMEGRPVFGQCGFEDAMHVVFTAQEKGLVLLEKGMVNLTLLGHAYHAPYWNPKRSFAKLLEDRRALAQQVLQNAERQQGRAEQQLYDTDSDGGFDDSDGGALFDDTLM